MIQYTVVQPHSQERSLQGNEANFAGEVFFPEVQFKGVMMDACVCVCVCVVGGGGDNGSLCRGGG